MSGWGWKNCRIGEQSMKESHIRTNMKKTIGFILLTSPFSIGASLIGLIMGGWPLLSLQILCLCIPWLIYFKMFKADSSISSVVVLVYLISDNARTLSLIITSLVRPFFIREYLAKHVVNLVIYIVMAIIIFPIAWKAYQKQQETDCKQCKKRKT